MLLTVLLPDYQQSAIVWPLFIHKAHRLFFPSSLY